MKPPRQMFMIVISVRKKGSSSGSGISVSKMHRDIDFTMKRGARGHPIGIRDKLRNLRM